jgi:hypothetical protein
MNRRIHCQALALGIAALLVSASFAQDSCRARIQISVDAEVPDPHDPSFITGLLADPQYRLTWVSGDSSDVVYDLSGPASDAGCANMIDRIRRAAAVLDVTVLESQP